MNPISDQALRTALDHEATSIVRQLQADNERLRNELATAKANLGNRYLRSVLCLIDRHREMGYFGLDVNDWRLVLHSKVDGEGEDDGMDADSQAMLDQLYRFPLEEKLAIIPVLCGLGYWAVEETDIGFIDRSCPFSVHWNHPQLNVYETDLRRVYRDLFSRGGILHHPH